MSAGYERLLLQSLPILYAWHVTCNWWQTKTMDVFGTVFLCWKKRKKGEISSWLLFVRFHKNGEVHRVTGSQNGWGGKGPLEVTCSMAPAQARPSRTGCPGLCRGSFWVSSRWGTPPWLFFSIYFISSPGCFLNCWARCKLKLLASSVGWTDPLGCGWIPLLKQGRHQDCPPKRRGEGATPFHSSKLLAQLTHLVKCHLKGVRQKWTVQRSEFLVEMFVFLSTLKAVHSAVVWPGTNRRSGMARGGGKSRVVAALTCRSLAVLEQHP